MVGDRYVIILSVSYICEPRPVLNSCLLVELSGKVEMGANINVVVSKGGGEIFKISRQPRLPLTVLTTVLM